MHIRPQLLLSTAAACVATLIASCGGGGGGLGGGGGSCSVANQKDFVLAAAREWYLFDTLLPANVDTGSFPTAQALLDFLTATARAQNKDRFFSFLTTPQADSSFLLEGQFIGFGFRTSIQANRLLVPDVYEGSPAALGGLARGAEITHINSGNGFVPVAMILQTDPNLTQALGPADVGVQRGLRFVRVGGQQVEANFTKAVVTIPPIPTNGATILTLPSNPSVQVGYIHLRTFVSTADTPLRNAYANFRAQGIQDFIVDYRYNGGGLVNTANLIGDLNGGNRADGQDVYSNMQFNAARAAANNVVRRFDVLPQSVSPVRIAFITTGASASASELVINSMKPWVEVAIVGSDTFGKPVGQSAFDLGGCDFRLRLVAFKLTNADGEGDYFDGLGPTLSFACAASDDLTRAPGDSAESSTAAALFWLGTGACGQIMSAPAGPQLQSQIAPMTWPEGSPATAAQAYLPGLF